MWLLRMGSARGEGAQCPLGRPVLDPRPVMRRLIMLSLFRPRAFAMHKTSLALPDQPAASCRGLQKKARDWGFSELSYTCTSEVCCRETDGCYAALLVGRGPF